MILGVKDIKLSLFLVTSGGINALKYSNVLILQSVVLYSMTFAFTVICELEFFCIHRGNGGMYPDVEIVTETVLIGSTLSDFACKN